MSVGSAGGFVPRSTRQPTDRPPLPLPWEQHPPKLLPSRGFLPVRTRRPTRSCPWPKWPAKMAPRVLFFLFLRYEVEIPRRRGVEIPPRIRLSLPQVMAHCSLSLPQVMAPPQLRGDPCEANLPGAFSRPKWRGCGPQANLRGFFPPTTPVRGCSPFLQRYIQSSKFAERVLPVWPEEGTVAGSQLTMWVLIPGLDLHLWEDRENLRFLPHPEPLFSSCARQES